VGHVRTRKESDRVESIHKLGTAEGETGYRKKAITLKLGKLSIGLDTRSNGVDDDGT